VASWRPVSSNSTLKLLGAIDSLLIHCFLCCVFVHPSFCNYTHALLSCNTPLPKHQTTTPGLSNSCNTPLPKHKTTTPGLSISCNTPLPKHQTTTPALSNVAPSPSLLLLRLQYYESFAASIVSAVLCASVVSAVLRIFCYFYCAASIVSAVLRVFCCFYFFCSTMCVCCVCSTTNLLLLLLCCFYCVCSTTNLLIVSAVLRIFCIIQQSCPIHCGSFSLPASIASAVLRILCLQYYESFAASNVSAVLRIFCIIQQRLPYPLWLLLPPCFYCVCSITNIVSAVLRIFCCFYCVCSTTNLLLLLLCLQYYESFADGPYLYIVMELVEVRNALHSNGAYNGLHSHTQSWSVHSQCST